MFCSNRRWFMEERHNGGSRNQMGQHTAYQERKTLFLFAFIQHKTNSERKGLENIRNSFFQNLPQA